MLIKSRNFSPTKCEGTFEKTGFGWAPGQEKRFIAKFDRKRFGKGHSLAFGTCKGCARYTGSKRIGEHCNLPADIHCER